MNLTEKLPEAKQADYSIPLYGFNQFSDLVVMDHQKSELLLVSVVFVDGTPLRESYSRALDAISKMQKIVEMPTPAMVSEPNWPEPDAVSNTLPKISFLKKSS